MDYIGWTGWGFIAVFPLTYVLIILWLVMVFAISSITLRMGGAFLGWFLGLLMLGNGDTWLVINETSLTVSSINFVTSYDYLLGLFVIGVSIVQALIVAITILDARKQGLTWRQSLGA